MKISIITPTIRLEGLEIVARSLREQTHRDFEWLVCSKEKPLLDCVWIPDTFEGGYWTLNRAYNKLFQACTGELIVSWQDYVYANKNALEKFLRAYKDKKGVISGVGDQYLSLDKYKRPTIKIWHDPRKTNKYGSFYECTFPDIEYNFCAIPTDLVYKAGGADEMLDFLGYGGDLYSLSDRLNDMGAHFYLDQTNESHTLRHGRERQDWDEKHVLFSGEYEKRKQELKKLELWPQLNYLVNKV